MFLWPALGYHLYAGWGLLSVSMPGLVGLCQEARPRI